MLGCLSPIASSKPNVAVYRGDGAGWRSVHSTVKSLQQLLPPAFKVDTIDTQDLLEGGWQGTTALLVMPGGADLPYCRRLNGRGNKLISEYVSAGGAYLGLCAGAYYACSRVEFEPGGPLEVRGDRELCFFPGVAAGAAYAGFDYMTEAGAAAAPVVFLQTAALGITIAHQQVPPHPMAVSAPTGEQSSEAGGVTGAQSSSNAAGSCQQGQWVACWDYCNGGPVFLPPASQPADTARRRDIQGSSSSSMQASAELPAGVMPLAYYTALPHRPHLIAWGGTLQLPNEAAIAAAAVMPAPDPDMSQDMPEKQPSVAALAAVRCEVGAGTVVLCSTHPELHPEWLDPAGSRHEVWQQQQQQTRAGGKNSTDQPRSAAAGASDGQLDGGGEEADEGLVWHTAALHQRLQACQASRELLLATLVWEALRHRLSAQ